MTSTTHVVSPSGRPAARRNAASRWQGVRRPKAVRMVGRLPLANALEAIDAAEVAS